MLMPYVVEVADVADDVAVDISVEVAPVSAAVVAVATFQRSYYVAAG